MVWDFVYARRLLSNGTYRPIHDAVLGFERCMVAKARRILDAPLRYLAQVKTDCLLTQRLPKRAAGAGGAAPPGRHAGLPRGRDEAVAGRPKQWRWNGVDDPVGHCLAPCCSRACRAPESTWPGQGCESRARRCTWCPRRTAPRRTWGWGRRRPTTGCAGVLARTFPRLRLFVTR